jgi:para-nitrobenzyl esterase
MKRIVFLLLIYFSNPMSFFAEAQTPTIVASKNVAVVQTTYGSVRGYMHNSIYTFKGIPYGKAERFMPPQNPTPWRDVRSCMAYGPTCPTGQAPDFSDEFEFAFQPNRGYHVSEHCLNLNIWTKQIVNTTKNPVMVWLHGGGFASGSSVEFPSQDGENLSKNGDVVVVSINHRLNVLGFLDLSAYGKKYQASANVGVMDMVASLNWVKENISNFGGDPTNVTIFGQSGGGAKVMCLMNAPAARGLFHKAIVQSGSYLNHFIESTTAKKVSSVLLEELGLRPDQVDSLQTMAYELLDAAGRKALLKVQQTLKPQELPVFGLDWEPVHNDYLPYQPDEPAALALSKNIPLLVGSVKNEFNPFIPGSNDISMDSVKIKLQKKIGDKTTAYLTAVKKTYPATAKPSDYMDIDLVFRPLVIEHANQKSVPNAAAVYTYLFTWQSPVLDGALKALHCMDLPFVFNNTQRCEEMTGGGEEAYSLAIKMSEAWINFARIGNPNHKSLPLWPAYTRENGATMIFDNTCKVEYHHDKELLTIGTGKNFR